MLTILAVFHPLIWALLGLWSFVHGDTMCGIGFMALYHLDKQTQQGARR